MFATFITVALFAAAKVAAFNVPTPQINQCQDVTLTWDNTEGPYDVLIVPADNVCEGDIIADLGIVDGTSVTWKANVPPNTQVVISVLDNKNVEAWSNSITIGGSNDASCLNATFTSASSAASSTSEAASTYVVPTSYQAAVPPTPSTPAGGLKPLGNVANNNPLTSGAISHSTTPMLVLGAISAVLAFSL